MQESCVRVETAIHAQCLELAEALRRREEALVEFARRERDLQLRRLRDEVATCTGHLQHTTALVQFCIEALKESDSSAFLQVTFCFYDADTFSFILSQLFFIPPHPFQFDDGAERIYCRDVKRLMSFFVYLFSQQIGSMLVNRVSNLDLTWRQEMDELTSRPVPSLELTLDDLGLRRSIDQMTFLEMKRNFPLNLVFFFSCFHRTISRHPATRGRRHGGFI